MAEGNRLAESGMFFGMDSMTDESAKKLLPQMLSVLSQADSPVFPEVIQFLRKRENIVFPYVSDILQSNDGNRKYWVMNQLIPGFSLEHKMALREELESICYLPSSSEEDMTLSDCAEECLELCFG